MVPGTSYNLLEALDAVLYACSVVFYTEAVLKVLAFGWAAYLRDSWCRLEFLLLIPPTLELVDAILWPTEPTYVMGYMRALNIFRVLRLLKDAKEVRGLLTTFVLSLPSLANVSSLLVLFVYVYAVLGVQAPPVGPEPIQPKARCACSS